MSNRVVITGLGVISSIGIGWREFWDSLLRGRSGIRPVTSFDTSKHFTHNGGEVKNFRPEEFIRPESMPYISRASQLAIAAARLAIEDASLTSKLLSNAGICIGLTSGSIQVIEHINDRLIRNDKVSENLLRQLPVHSPSALVAKEFDIKGPTMTFSTACAAGNYSIGYGFDLIKSGLSAIMLTGAPDPFSRISYTGFNQFKAVAPERCQPFDKNRKGMMVAEGAGIMVLESLENALHRGAHIYAEILGYGLSCDAYHITNSSVEGIINCMRKAMKEANITPDDVDYISAHRTGTMTNDKNECAAIKEVFCFRYREIPVSSIKSMLGHTMEQPLPLRRSPVP